MDLRLKFNEDVLNYDKWRPAYTPELFNDIICFSALDDTKGSLEIGIGTGQATLPILKTGCKVTAIEVGERLAEYSKQKFSEFNNCHVVNIDFESFNADGNTYDLIYSATAFHWISQDIGFTKTYDLLKSGGTVALFWNHPFVNREDDLLHVEIREIYKKYRPSDESPIEFTDSMCQKYTDMLKQYGFINITSKVYHKTRILQAYEYISLLNTYSDHRALQNDIKIGLEKEISSTIDNFGGKLRIYDAIDLYLANKS